MKKLLIGLTLFLSSMTAFGADREGEICRDDWGTIDPPFDTQLLKVRAYSYWSASAEEVEYGLKRIEDCLDKMFAKGLKPSRAWLTPEDWKNSKTGKMETIPTLDVYITALQFYKPGRTFHAYTVSSLT